MAVQRDVIIEHRITGDRYGGMRLFWSGVWVGTLAMIVGLMIVTSGCRREQPPSPQVTAPKLNSVIFLNRHWVESDAVRIIEGVIET